MRNAKAADEIRVLVSEGKTAREIAEIRGTSVPNIHQIAKRAGIVLNRAKVRKAASGNIEIDERRAYARAGGDERKQVAELEAMLAESRARREKVLNDIEVVGEPEVTLDTGFDFFG